MSLSAADRRIRSLRPQKSRVDPYRSHGSLLENERRPGGQIERAITMFLAGAECPFTCAFCDLWQWTIDGPTPPGALTKQIDDALSGLDGNRPDRLKLYNASNFFDPRAVPEQDLESIGELAKSFPALTVESHASTVGARTLEFARRFGGRLEVAMGLETIHPVASHHLNKRLDLARFDQAARFLVENDIDLRVFVLLGAPYIDSSESVDWTVRSVEHAAARGASVVSIIPVRGGNGEMERLREQGLFVPPTLAQLEEALDRCLVFGDCVVTADLWDAARLPACAICSSERIDRLRRLNLSGRPENAISCGMCGELSP
ncbi:MAG: radical SAM protein [Gemmatimonadaceae bacterium]